MYTANDYELDLRNGSLGKIVEALSVSSEHSECCVVDFEGRRIALNTKQLHAVCHSYAITVHKSQGAQFEKVIVPIRRLRLLDQALIYTAVTRAVEQVVLVGDEPAARAATLAPASASRRHVGLPSMLTVGVSEPGVGAAPDAG